MVEISNNQQISQVATVAGSPPAGEAETVQQNGKQIFDYSAGIAGGDVVIIGNDDEIPESPVISRAAKQAGEKLALQLYGETNSSYAHNKNVADILKKVDNTTAYSFFKEYARLSSQDSNFNTTGVMHDTFDISDIFNRINNKDINRAILGLLDQAFLIPGLSDTDEFRTLALLRAEIMRDRPNGDLSDGEAISMDNAINALVGIMSQKLE